MKQCPNCQMNWPEDLLFCQKCGTKLEAFVAPAKEEERRPKVNLTAQYQPPQFQGTEEHSADYDEYDHTSEYAPEDISENRLVAAVVYLLGVVGVIIGLLAAKDSKYVMFHIKQELKFIIVSTVVTIAMALLSWTFIVPIIGAVIDVALIVCELICVYNVLTNQVREAPIIRSFKFLK